MALKGAGSNSIGGTAVQLSTLIPGKVTARAMTFIAPAGNSGNIVIGGSDVAADGAPGYFMLEPGRSYNVPAPLNGAAFDVDFTVLYAIGSAASQTLNIVYTD